MKINNVGIFCSYFAPVFAQLIRTSDWEQNLGVRLVFGLSEKTEQKTNPKTEVVQCDRFTISQHNVKYKYATTICNFCTVLIMFVFISLVLLSLLIPAIWLRHHLLPGLVSVHLQILIEGICQLCGSWSVAGRYLARPHLWALAH